MNQIDVNLYLCTPSVVANMQISDGRCRIGGSTELLGSTMLTAALSTCFGIESIPQKNIALMHLQHFDLWISY